ncbi:hypothetical protein HK097_008309 [Rhizophlyctis rosea]|uniref:Pre-mRNA-splicing factor 38 n=1 Tax=Rhizophlyctis rosea TaxID=64517 RepID=A0AAD5SC09_9FUNG|nr:hypothetical protein HK097_008309 [Rhizophlyctis rosea]
MANRTATDAKQIHGTNPQFLIEKIVRTRIWDSLYWKEKCFALTAETIIDRAVELNCVGGQYGNQRPTEFLCLTLKLLQLQPEKDIVRLYIQNEDYKYLRALGAFYLRLTGTSHEIYSYLEPLYADSRKLRRRLNSGAFELFHMDEFIDELLRSDRVCDTILPRLQRREVLEETGDLSGPRKSVLEDELDEEELEELERGSESEEGAVSEAEGRDGDRGIEDSEREVDKGTGREEMDGGRNGHRDERERRDRSLDRNGDRRDDRSRSDRYDDRDRDRRRDDRYRDRRDNDRYHDRRDDRRDFDRHRDGRRDGDRYRDPRDDRDYDRRDRERSREKDRRRDRSRSRDRRDRSRDRSRDRRDRSYDRPSHSDRRSKSPLPQRIEEKKKNYSSKKFDSLFKKKDGGGGSSSKADAGNGGGGGGAKESLSVEETNKMRIALGLKPLKL